MKIFSAVALACALVGVAHGQSTSTQISSLKVAISDMFEVQSGKLASKKGNANVKTFGQMMVKDHTKTTSELKGLAAKAKAKLPTEMDAEHRKKLDQLQKLDGDEFNSTYASMQVQAHEEAVKLFDLYSRSGHDAVLKA
jgi:putative membrane protein